MAELLDLPPELIVLIINCMHPSCHFNFARANKLCFQLSTDVLARHAVYHQRAQPWSDTLPLTLPRLFHMVLKDPVAAYYVHHLAFWGSRTSWDLWQDLPLRDDRAPNHTLHAAMNTSNAGPACHIFIPPHIHAFRQILRRCPNLSEDLWIQKLLEGDESHFKVLLLAMLPHLTHLWLAAPIPALRLFLNSSFPPHPLSHLRNVSISIQDLRYLLPAQCCGFETIADVYLLPALESLYVLYDYAPDQAPDPADPACIPIGKSSVKTLLLDGTEPPFSDLLQMIAGAAALHTYVDSIGPENISGCLGALQQHHSDTLQNLDLGSQRDDLDFLQELYSDSPNQKNLTVFRDLKQVKLNAVAILKQITRLQYDGVYDGTSDPFRIWVASKYGQGSSPRFLNFASILPESIEILTFTPMEDKWAIGVCAADMLDALVSANLHDTTLPNLSAIFFNDLIEMRHWRSAGLREHLPRSFPELAQTAFLPWFQMSIAAGAQRGINVYTSSTHDPEEIEHIRRGMGMPMPLAEHDVKKYDDFADLRSSAQKEASQMQALATGGTLYDDDL
ncbi:hypothetical protein BDY17DRAFT_305799 [Neohortaea acidophila]|uniref:F-box domain-containing protein n=1 Tax=Neohortaea acidophila TaxID=245834 RepID=A0A6A6PFM5_9PEZI|nr:uncharacterized protein BDY17DRAFT_305799 [Neohortaea acidophila]KAF2478762.1 hypothetical protein BDY17DRAFT_305799 [Neohortaea acidophila]